jgi:hypothetical protein
MIRARQGRSGHDAVEPGAARPGRALQGSAGHGSVWQGTARRGGALF